MMNDVRNESVYQCVIVLQGTSTIQRESDHTILYVAGEYTMYVCLFFIVNDTKFIALS